MPPCVLSRSTVRAAALVLALSGAGCASVRVDELGRTHVVGLVWLTLPAPAERGAEQVRTRSLGLTLARNPLESAVVLGWSDRSVSVIEPDLAVRLPALEP